MSYFRNPNPEYNDPQNGSRWRAEDLANVTKHHHKQLAKMAEVIKEAKNRGINPGIKLEQGRMVPPPPGYDVFSGRVCQAPGKVKNGWGAERICGRQATATIQTLDPENFTPDTAGVPSAELTNDVLAYMAYGATAGPNPIPAATGPRKGRMLQPEGTVGPNAKFVCPFHSQVKYRDLLHVDDGGVIPDDRLKVPELNIGSIADIESFGFHRVIATDPNLTYLANRTATLTVRTPEYCRYLDSLGLLPEDGRLML